MNAVQLNAVGHFQVNKRIVFNTLAILLSTNYNVRKDTLLFMKLFSDRFDLSLPRRRQVLLSEKGS